MSLEPTTTYLNLDDDEAPSPCHTDDRFHILLVESTRAMEAEIRKSSRVPAVLVSMSLRPVAAVDYRLSVDGKVVPTTAIPAFRANVIDFAAEPGIWVGRALRYAHFHVRRSAIDDIAADLGYACAGGFRLALVEPDIVLARITKSILPYLGGETGPQPIALDHLEMILAAHLLQRYGGLRPKRAVVVGGLAAWQRRRAEELLRANLDGRVRLAAVASECGLSVSHFSRSFTASFGVSCHRWLKNRRIERAQDLLLRTTTPLVEVASQSGFGDQAAFTRTFHRLVGMSPGRWRREQAQR